MCTFAYHYLYTVQCCCVWPPLKLSPATTDKTILILASPSTLSYGSQFGTPSICLSRILEIFFNESHIILSFNLSFITIIYLCPLCIHCHLFLHTCTTTLLFVCRYLSTGLESYVYIIAVRLVTHRYWHNYGIVPPQPYFLLVVCTSVSCSLYCSFCVFLLLFPEHMKCCTINWKIRRYLKPLQSQSLAIDCHGFWPVYAQEKFIGSHIGHVLIIIWAESQNSFARYPILPVHCTISHHACMQAGLDFSIDLSMHAWMSGMWSIAQLSTVSIAPIKAKSLQGNG